MHFNQYSMENKHNTAIPMMVKIVNMTEEKTVIQKQESIAQTTEVNIVFHSITKLAIRIMESIAIIQIKHGA